MQPDKPPPALRARLECLFRDAKAPGSLATALTVSPETAAELAVKQFAAFLRDQAATMWRQGRTTDAAIIDRLARETDPLGSVMGAPAAGGTD